MKIKIASSCGYSVYSPFTHTVTFLKLLETGRIDISTFKSNMEGLFEAAGGVAATVLLNDSELTMERVADTAPDYSEINEEGVKRMLDSMGKAGTDTNINPNAN